MGKLLHPSTAFSLWALVTHWALDGRLVLVLRTVSRLLRAPFRQEGQPRALPRAAPRPAQRPRRPAPRRAAPRPAAAAGRGGAASRARPGPAPPRRPSPPPQAAKAYRGDVLTPWFDKYAKANNASIGDLEAFKKAFDALHGVQLASTLTHLLPVANLDSGWRRRGAARDGARCVAHDHAPVHMARACQACLLASKPCALGVTTRESAWGRCTQAERPVQPSPHVRARARARGRAAEAEAAAGGTRALAPGPIVRPCPRPLPPPPNVQRTKPTSRSA